MNNPENSVAASAKKAGADLARAHKSAVSKHFAASFVDLQQRVRDTMSTDIDGHVARKTIIKNMDIVISNLESFLSNNGLSDTLLVRMVVINAFTVSQLEVPMSKVLVWRFGTALAQRVEYGVDKMVEARSENPSSIRGVSPLLLTCDYVSHFASGDDSCAEAEAVFWSKVCDVVNKVTILTHTFRLKDADIKGKLPREYGDLIGFTPFETFIDKPQPFLSIEDAKDVLPLLQDVSSSSLKRQCSESAGNPMDNRIKLAHFLAIVEGSPKVTKGMDGDYHFVGECDGDDDDDDDDAPADFDEPSIAAQIAPEPDVLQYKVPEHGGGPALLVPGALLLSIAASDTPKHTDPVVDLSTDASFVVSNLASTDRTSVVPVAHRAPAAIDYSFPTPTNEPSPVAKNTPPPTLFPPLAPSPVAKNTPPPTLFPPLAPSPVAKDVPPPTLFPPLTPPPGLRAPPGLKPPPGFAPQTEIISTKQPPAWDFLSLQPTSNPFMQPVTEYYPPAASQALADPNDYLDHDETMAFLDSSLLQSLWCDDANQPLSKNPFLAGAK